MSLTSSPPYLPATLTESEPHWTAAEFYRAAAAGEFDDPDRLELIHGRLTRIMQGERHANLTARLSRRLRRALDPPLFMREEKPIHIALDEEPIPDLMLTYEEEYPGRHPEPQETALLVEVADTSAEKDLGEKAMLYAQSAITDYWFVLVNEAVLVVHRAPTADGYQDVARLAGQDTLSPLAMPEVVWTINELLERTEAAEEN